MSNQPQYGLYPQMVTPSGLVDVVPKTGFMDRIYAGLNPFGSQARLQSKMDEVTYRTRLANAATLVYNQACARAIALMSTQPFSDQAAKASCVMSDLEFQLDKARENLKDIADLVPIQPSP